MKLLHKARWGVSLVLLLIGLGPLVAQTIQPNCQYKYRFTNRTGDPTDAVTNIAVSGSAAVAPTINNSTNGCIGWQLQYSSEGFSAVTLTLQTAPRTNAGGINEQPSGTWSTFSGTNVLNSLPLTSTSGSTYTGYAFFPYIRVNATTLTGTGSVEIILNGWKSIAYAKALGSGGSSGATGRCTFTAATTCSISLLGVADQAAVTCYDNSGTLTELSPNSFDGTTSDLLVVNFSAAQTGYCNAIAGTGATGATGADGAAGAAGAAGQIQSINSDTTAAQTIGGTSPVSASTSSGATTITLGTVPVSKGGTGITSDTAYAIITGGTTSTGALQQVSGLGTSGQALISAGAGALPAWATLSIPVSGLSNLGTNVGTFLITPSSANLLAAVTDETGSGLAVFNNTPTLITPILGVATATSINGLTLTSSTGTFTLTNGKTFSALKTITLDGTDSTTMTFPTTSATIARTDAANTFTGHQTIEGVTSTGATGTGAFMFSASPTATGTLGAAAITATGVVTISTNGALSAPAITATGTWVTGGSATTTKPYVLIETTGATSTAWSTSGTGLGINAASGFAGNLVDFQVNGSSKFSADLNGNITAGGLTSSGTININTIRSTGNDVATAFQTRNFTAANKVGVIVSSGTWSQTSGTNGAMSITPTYNQSSGTAANTDLLINRTETAVGSGAQFLLDMQVGGTSKASVTNGGIIKATGYQSSDGTAGATVTTCTGFKNGLCISGT